MNIFDILGPVMIGPSSSHTAGAVRAGNVAARLLGKPIVSAKITLYGSFAKTYYGHGTDCAILGGILGFSSDDRRIPNSHQFAEQSGIEYKIIIENIEMAHPNTVKLELTSADNSEISVTVESVGGGSINVVKIDDADVSFTTEYFTTVIFNEDKSGVMSGVTSVYAQYEINIAFMKLFRYGKSAIMVIESDQALPKKAEQQLRLIRHVNRVIDIEPFTD